MKPFLLLACALFQPFSPPRSAAPPPLPDEEFFRVDVVLETGGEHLACWKVEVLDRTGVAEIVGLEGGEHPAFAAPPEHDPRALQQARVVLEASQARGELPAGRVRVARLHFQVSGPGVPDLVVRPLAAADAHGRAFAVRATLAR